MDTAAATTRRTHLALDEIFAFAVDKQYLLDPVESLRTNN